MPQNFAWISLILLAAVAGCADGTLCGQHVGPTTSPAPPTQQPFGADAGVAPTPVPGTGAPGQPAVDGGMPGVGDMGPAPLVPDQGASSTTDLALPDSAEPPPPDQGAPSPPPSSASQHVPAGYALTWSDEFDTLSLDPQGNGSAKWATYYVGWNVRHLQGNNDKCLKADTSYTGTGGAALGLTMHELNPAGTLSLLGQQIPSGRQGQFHGFPFACGMISSQRSHSQKYGYWELRMRINNVSKGHHWAIWLVPEDNSWPPEVDVLEVVGTNPSRNCDAKRFHLNVHWDDGGHQSNMTYFDAPKAKDAWYTLGFEWTASEMIWTVDGVEKKRHGNVTHKPMYFLISPEIGGDWPGMPDGATKWPAEMEIDYVRVYAKP